MSFAARPLDAYQEIRVGVEDRTRIRVRKVSFGDGLEFNVELLPPDLRRRWDLICDRLERGDNAADLGPLTREVASALLPTIMMRVAHSAPQNANALVRIGQRGAGEHGAVITDLAALLAEYAKKEKRKEGVKAPGG
jgi:hypothetical protein